MNPLALVISRGLIHFVWQGLLVWSLLSVTLFALRKKSAAARYAASCAALAMLAVMPLVTIGVLYAGPDGPALMTTAGTSLPGAVITGGGGTAQTDWLRLLQSW